MLVCSLGDLLLDVIVRLARPLTTGADAEARTSVGPGGQAANVAAWVASLGASARFVGKRASDEAGALAASGLAARGVEVVGPVVPGGTGVVVSVVSPDAERTMASDRGVAPDLRADELDPAWAADCDHLHLPGYSLAREPIQRAALEAARVTRRAGGRVSVDLSASTLVLAYGPSRFRALLEELAPDVVFCNEDEERAIGGKIDGPLWIVKRGRHGASFGRVSREPVPVGQAVDTTGAGDAFAAGWIVGGPELALEAAARCVVQAGAMPPPPVEDHVCAG